MTNPATQKGAEALLVALQTPSPKGYMGIPVLLWGKPGEGKSSFLENLESPGFPVLTLIASIHDPTDFSGLPVLKDDFLHYAVPEWVKQFEDSTSEGILFLDELTTAPPAVQSALLRLVLERKLGFHNLPKGIRIVAAANPPDLMSGGWDLSPPLRNRFVHIVWEMQAEVYLHALQHGYSKPELPELPKSIHDLHIEKWKLRVGAFLKQAPQMLTTMPDQNHAFATPRSWDYAISLMASCTCLNLDPDSRGYSETFSILLKGCVGEGVMLAFMNFIQNMNLPDPEEVLLGRVGIKVENLNDGELYIFFGSLTNTLERYREHKNLPALILRYFNLCKAVFDNYRRDVIYVSIKKGLKSGLPSKALSSSQQNADTNHQQLIEVMHNLFSDEGLKEFIDIFE